jgi:hypothetical protein
MHLNEKMHYLYMEIEINKIAVKLLKGSGDLVSMNVKNDMV